MPEFELDPRDTIDRKAEQELFAGLVSFASPAQMLVIRDKLGRGKSTLLKRLQYNCKYEIKPQIPACLIDVGQMADPSPFSFVAEVVKALKIEDRFPKFGSLNKARGDRDYGPFDSASAKLTGKVTVKGDVRGEAVGIKIEQAAHVQLGPGEFTAEQEHYARQKCIEAFFEDLRVLCATQPVVLLLDTWERCNHDLREWMVDTLLRQHCFHPDKNLRPAKLAVVVAGNSYDPAKERFGLRDNEFIRLFRDEEEHAAAVLSIKSLSDWDSEHVREFLRQHGYGKVRDEDIDYLRDCLKRGRTLQQILEGYRALSADDV